MSPVGQPGQVFADLQSGNSSRDRAEFASDTSRSLGLHVEAVELRQPAGEEDHENRSGSRVGLAGGQHIGQTGSRQAESAGLQQCATGQGRAGCHAVGE